MADWSKLPYDIIHKVSAYLIAIEDFVAFSAVCSSWRSVYLAKQWHQGPQVPLLMLSYSEKSSLRSFVSLYRNKVYNSELPEASGRRCWGSSLGWIVTLGNDLKFHLLNPFTRVSLSLPPKSSLRIHFGERLDWHEIIEKAFVFRKIGTTSQSNEEDLLVVIIYGPLKQLAFCRPSFSSWRSVKSTSSEGFRDVACVRDQIFAVCDMGYPVVIDVDNSAVIDYNRPHTCQQLFLSFPYWGSEQLFLVESSGDLWLVHQNKTGLSRRSVKSIEFLVYSFDFSKEEWTLLSDLGNHAIFLGDGCSVSVSDPERLNCKSNAIYFVRKNMERRWPYREHLVDLGVYSVADGISQPLLCGPDMPPYHSFPLWVTPTLH